MVKERTHTVSRLIHEHREKLATKLLASKMALLNWKNGVGPNIGKKLLQRVNFAENMHATFYGDNQFLVETRRGDALIYVKVDVVAKECSCLAWQMSGLPCPHTCVAIKLLNGNVYTFVDDCFTLSAQEKIYAHSMRLVATHDCPYVDAPTVTQMLTETFLEPPITTRPPGRQKRKRVESQFQNKMVYHCGRCHEPGHSVKTCKNPNPA
ncbi:hypothetical protein QN277_021839 [Acacia crassicarpa]|uniref:SWIM-type domain-containing protein n=1 Tax=Acacia crassicarpa TaxID=499986 RepID=A0AAE1JMM2_9FABA|nr:hypothetical protein QN277_021839 [Acacia crassicarpa]